MSRSAHLPSTESNEITQESQEVTDVASLPMAAATLQDSNHQKAHKLIKLASEDLNFVKEASENIKKFDKHFDSKLEDAFRTLNSLESLLKDVAQDSSVDPLYDEVQHFKKCVKKLKLQIPFNVKVNSNERGGNLDIRLNGSSRGNRVNNQNLELSRIVSVLFADAKFKLSSGSKDFLMFFDGLDINLKLCLLCFSVFPENAIIKTRLMINWWIGEGFIIPPFGDKRTADELGAEYFDELIQKGFIIPAHKKRTLRVNRCKMHPFARSALVLVSKEAKFFDFDTDAIPKDEYSSSLRACLTGNGLVLPENLHRVHTLFNLNEDIIDFKPELFFKMKNVNVIYLGRWQASAKHHVEIDDSKILEGFKVMKHLKFLSLQGISRITELPASVSMLRSLTVLDLRACHSLEVIPEEIGCLESLTHLDMSECYLLTRMPKELSLLKSLLVLKGFIVGVRSEDKTLCSLEDLAKLPKLRKLGIYTNKENFPDDQDLIAFSKFDYLKKLLITWGSNQAKKTEKSTVEGVEQKQEANVKQGAAATNKNMSNRLSRSYGMRGAKPPGLPSGLEKLDLRCYPGKFSP